MTGKLPPSADFRRNLRSFLAHAARFDHSRRQRKVNRRPSWASCLVAVFSQGNLQLALESFMDQRVTTTQPALSLGADPNVPVARSARTVLDLPRAGEAKTLFDPFVGLHLVGHKPPAILSKFRTRDSIDRRPDPEGDKSEFRQRSGKKRLSVCFLPGNRPNPGENPKATRSKPGQLPRSNSAAPAPQRHPVTRRFPRVRQSNCQHWTLGLSESEEREP